jgi:hypothetical protein
LATVSPHDALGSVSFIEVQVYSTNNSHPDIHALIHNQLSHGRPEKERHLPSGISVNFLRTDIQNLRKRSHSTMAMEKDDGSRDGILKA